MRSLKSQPIVSIIIIAVNVLVFILCTFTGNLLYMRGKLDAFSVLVQGEYGRILWAMFLHGGMHHLFNNMLLLLLLGSMLEKEAGHVKYAVVYFLSGIGGNLLSLLAKVMNHDLSSSIGASGAIFGLDGMLLAMALFSGRKIENLSLPRVLFMIAYSLYNGFTGENIDNAAHVGGLITGFAVAGIMCIPGRWRDGMVSGKR